MILVFCLCLATRTSRAEGDPVKVAISAYHNGELLKAKNSLIAELETAHDPQRKFQVADLLFDICLRTWDVECVFRLQDKLTAAAAPLLPKTSAAGYNLWVATEALAAAPLEPATFERPPYGGVSVTGFFRSRKTRYLCPNSDCGWPSPAKSTPISRSPIRDLASYFWPLWSKTRCAVLGCQPDLTYFHGAGNRWQHSKGN